MDEGENPPAFTSNKYDPVIVYAEFAAARAYDRALLSHRPPSELHINHLNFPVQDYTAATDPHICKVAATLVGELYRTHAVKRCRQWSDIAASAQASLLPHHRSADHAHEGQGVPDLSHQSSRDGYAPPVKRSRREEPVSNIHHPSSGTATTDQRIHAEADPNRARPQSGLQSQECAVPPNSRHYGGHVDAESSVAGHATSNSPTGAGLHGGRAKLGGLAKKLKGARAEQARARYSIQVHGQSIPARQQGIPVRQQGIAAQARAAMPFSNSLKAQQLLDSLRNPTVPAAEAGVGDQDADKTPSAVQGSAMLGSVVPDSAMPHSAVPHSAVPASVRQTAAAQDDAPSTAPPENSNQASMAYQDGILQKDDQLHKPPSLNALHLHHAQQPVSQDANHHSVGHPAGHAKATGGHEADDNATPSPVHGSPSSHGESDDDVEIMDCSPVRQSTRTLFPSSPSSFQDSPLRSETLPQHRMPEQQPQAQPHQAEQHQSEQNHAEQREPEQQQPYQAVQQQLPEQAQKPFWQQQQHAQQHEQLLPHQYQAQLLQQQQQAVGQPAWPAPKLCMLSQLASQMLVDERQSQPARHTAVKQEARSSMSHDSARMARSDQTPAAVAGSSSSHPVELSGSDAGSDGGGFSTASSSVDPSQRVPAPWLQADTAASGTTPGLMFTTFCLNISKKQGVSE